MLSMFKNIQTKAPTILVSVSLISTIFETLTGQSPHNDLDWDFSAMALKLANKIYAQDLQLANLYNPELTDLIGSIMSRFNYDDVD